MSQPLNILCFQPYNQAVVYIESTIEKMARQGHNTYLLTFAGKGDTHKNMERFGCKTYSLSSMPKVPFFYQLLRVFQLALFCRKHQIDIVYSHYQESNLIAVLAQFFTKAKFIITRHHSDCGYLDHNRKEIIADKIINYLAKIQIAPSNKVYHQMVKVEGCDPQKVKRIDYGYNFAAFPQPDQEKVKMICEEWSGAPLLIVMAARFIPEKRHKLLFKTIRQLRGEGYDIRALVPGRGPEEDAMKNYVRQYHLQDAISFPGFQRDIQNYFAAADLIVHLSVSEASNSAIKEAALQGKTVVVCEGVGDFSDYIEHGRNGFLISREDCFHDLISLLKKIYEDRESLELIGNELRNTVRERFNIDTVFPSYEQLHQDLLI